jgi:predicted transcriptional regulator
MHTIFNPKNLLGKPLEISYDKNSVGEFAKVIDIGENQYKILFERFPEDDDEDGLIWTNQEPVSVEDDTAHFETIGNFNYQRGFNFYLKISNQEQKKLEYNTNMKTTVKELSDKLGVDVVYVNGFIQTLVKLGKASIVGKVERPAGTRGKPSNIYEIQEGIL